MDFVSPVNASQLRSSFDTASLPAQGASFLHNSDSLLNVAVPKASQSSLVFIDAGVTGYESLKAGVNAGAEVYVLDSKQDAIAQITQTLLNKQGISSVHIVSHGQAGGLDFGSGVLNLTQLPGYAAQLQSWSNALTEDADILLYGCNVASDELGQAFVSILSQLTGADVAASDDLTGSSALGGNWTLEVNTGAIETSLAFAATTLADYNAILPISRVSTATDGTEGNNRSYDPSLSADGRYVAFNSYASNLVSGDTNTTNDIFVKDTQTGSISRVSTATDGTEGNSTSFNPSLSADGRYVAFYSYASNLVSGDTNNTYDIFVAPFPPNQAPALTLPDPATLSYTENGIGIALTTSSTVVDSDSTDFDTGTLRVKMTAGAIASDRLTVTAGGTVTLDARKVLVNGTHIGTTSGGIGSDDLVITLNANANASNVSDLLNAIRYSNTSQSLPSGSRTLEFTLSDGDGSTSSAVTQTVTVTGVNDAPFLGNPTVLYDGTSNQTPDQGDWFAYRAVDGTPTVTPDASGTTLTTDSSVYAGYSNYQFTQQQSETNITYTSSLKNPNFPTLDRTQGFVLNLSAQLQSEARTSTANKNNDGKDDLAGFSLLIVTSDLMAIELGFQQTGTGTGRIFAQDDGIAEPDGTAANDYRTLFTQAEGVDFDTTALNSYSIAIQDDTYTLYANGTEILSGRLRDYTALVPQSETIGPVTITSPDSYELPNHIFFGDNTPSAQASVKITSVALLTPTALVAETTNEDTPTAPRNFSVFDFDNAASSLTTSGSSSNTTLVPNTNISTGGSGNLRNITVTPAANQNGNTTITYQVSDGTDTTSQTFDLTVTPVNDKPSFTKGSNISISAGAGAQSISSWATDFNPGPADESSQTVLGYTISSNTHPDLFTVAPSIDANGTLTFTPVASISQPTTVMIGIKVQDNGGIANGGIDTSDEQTFTITINPVNQAPSFTASNPAAINEDSGAQIVSNWATFNSGASFESSQTATYTVSNLSNPSLFSVAPTISSNGTLTYTPAADANGTTTFDVVVQDNGGTANGGIDTSTQQTFTITVNSVNDQPSFTASNPVAVTQGSGPQTIANWATFNSGATNESNQTATYTVSHISNPSVFAVAPSIDASGTLTYTPAANANGTTTFDVVVQDNGGTANGGLATSVTQTFSLTVQPLQLSISPSTTSLSEGNNGTTAYTFTVNLSGPSTQPVTVQYSTGDSTAQASDGDYQAVSNQLLTFAPGETQKTITILVNGDTKHEADESFQVSLNTPTGAILSTSSATGTLLNDDAKPSITIGNTSVLEGNSGTKALTFTLNLSNPADQEVTVQYTLTDGSATLANADYQALASNTLTFAAGQTEQTITINVNGDTQVEANETVRLLLSNPSSNATLPNPTAVGTIVNDDSAVNDSDFAGNGNPGFLWHNKQTGVVGIWKMNGTSLVSPIVIGTAAPLWDAQATVDFDGDGHTDILWRHRQTGDVGIWKMNGTSFTSASFLARANSNWKIEGVADFDADGKVDLLWRNTINGDVGIWKLNGTAYSSAALVSPADLSWQIEGLADFNGDGKVDILWRHRSSGDVGLWQMNGLSLSSAQRLSTADRNWSIQGLADFDGDGQVDILWRHAVSGDVGIWKMNGTSFTSATRVGPAASNWNLAGLLDLNGDGKMDMLWRNLDSGDIGAWKMNGTTLDEAQVVHFAGLDWDLLFQV